MDPTGNRSVQSVGGVVDDSTHGGTDAFGRDGYAGGRVVAEHLLFECDAGGGDVLVDAGVFAADVWEGEVGDLELKYYDFRYMVLRLVNESNPANMAVSSQDEIS